MPDGGTFAEIVDHGERLGLQPCALEVAPHLRLSYLDQADGPYLTVVSPELHPNSEFPNGFYLRRLDSQLWLRGYEAGAEVVFAPAFTDFVFRVSD